jgi:hypothetical protein
MVPWFFGESSEAVDCVSCRPASSRISIPNRVHQYMVHNFYSLDEDFADLHGISSLLRSFYRLGEDGAEQMICLTHEFKTQLRYMHLQVPMQLPCTVKLT